MAHHVMIDGTSYAVGGGTALIDGTKYQIGGGGRTLIDGTAYKINFTPSEYIMTLTGSGGTITYNGVTQTSTFRVAAGDSIVCKASYNSTEASMRAHAIIILNGTTVKEASGGRSGSVSYTYTPTANATITLKTTGINNFPYLVTRGETIEITETP